MSASAKIVLRKKPNSKGLFPLAIRITKNRRSTYKHIGHYIDIDDWDERSLRVKKSHPNADSLNNLLSSKLSEVDKGIMNLQSESRSALRSDEPLVAKIPLDQKRKVELHHCSIIYRNFNAVHCVAINYVGLPF